ncbi:long-chain fatty acid--CoA ligase [Desulfobulbus alkaliphilus]|nr:long-chain fatty acid--CoA ligase [Desulfobulbus alkaliphilus]MBM9537556.1 long-chain fatty acid--CoA ligase [Desulfobulbus alkaliphilus]
MSLPDLFRQRCQKTPDAVAYRQFDRLAGIWRGYTWQEVGNEVSRWRNALRRTAMQPGDRVALWMANSVAWVCCEQAALAEGLVVVPLYARDNPENLTYILNDCSCSLLVVDHSEQWGQLLDCGQKMTALQRVICLQETDESVNLDILQSAVQWLPGKQPEEPVPGTELNIQAHDPATIVYTSGTTGLPKGVMLSHANILSNCRAVLDVHPARPDDIFLSFLPLSHSFERTVGYYIPMMAGCCIAYCRSIQELAEDLQVIQPTVLISVPRIFEKISARIQEQLNEKGKMAQLLFAAAVKIGYRRFLTDRARTQARITDRLFWPVLKRLVADKILRRFGGRLRLAVTGGAPLQVELSRQFIGLGLPLVQGYGLTEAAPVVSANHEHDNRPESVGPPLPGVEIRLNEEGELQVKSPGVMLGYWNNEEQTRESLDSEGWLKTGDIARVEDGYIYIIGRSKEILVTSTGEKIAPVPLEMTLEQHPLIEQAMVVGEGKPYIIALLSLDVKAWQQQATGLGLDPNSAEALHDPTARSTVLATVSGRLHKFPASAQIRGVVLTTEKWSIDNGLLTPTLKLIRNRIATRYAMDIESVYQQHHGRARTTT